jgi:hypothetical protein
MEGWLYFIRSNRIGLQYSRKRYFFLEFHHLKSFKSAPISNNKVHAHAFLILFSSPFVSSSFASGFDVNVAERVQLLYYVFYLVGFRRLIVL